MTQRIGRLPSVLVSYLETLDGLSVNQLSNLIVPTLDIAEFFQLTKYERDTQTVALTTGANVWVVPPGEAWFVRQHVINVGVPVGANLRIAPAFNLFPATPLCPLVQYQSFTALELCHVGSNEGYWVRPGGGIGYVAPTFAGSFNINLSITFARYRI